MTVLQLKNNLVSYQNIQADGLSVLQDMADESIDSIVTDPAYESLEKYRKVGTTTRLKVSESSSNKWFDVVPNEYIGEQLIEMYRVLKNNSHAYIMCDQETMFYIRPAAESAGFKWWKAIIWDKGRDGMGYHYRASHEVICFIEKGQRQLNSKSISDILKVKSLRGKGNYPTEKPVELSEILIKNSTNLGDTILDLYAGSGSVMEAALKNGRNAIGVDTSSNAINVAKARMDTLNFTSNDKLIIPRVQRSLFVS